MQRDVRDIGVRQLKRFFNQISAVFRIGFFLDAFYQSVHLRVGVAARVVIAVAAHANTAHQRLKAVQRVKRWHAPAQHVNTGFVALNHREVGDQRQCAQLGLDANF